MTVTWKSVRAALAASPLGPVWRHSKVAWRTRPLVRAIAEPQPENPKGRVVLAALTSRGFDHAGKMTARSFLPAFCDRLRQLGYETAIVTSRLGLRRHPDATVIYVYMDEAPIPESDRPGYNLPASGRVIRSKRATHAALSRHVPMPALVDRAADTVFSNADDGTGLDVFLIENDADLDPSRYNTEYVDTRRRWNGRDYHVSLRALCIGPEVLHVYVRARDAGENNPSVHAKDTPVDADLLNHLHAETVTPLRMQIDAIAEGVAETFGPGFYAHDILPSRDGRAILCETGYKFNDATYFRRLSPIAAAIGAADLAPVAMARKSAEVFAAQIAVARDPSTSVGRIAAEDSRRPVSS